MILCSIVPTFGAILKGLIGWGNNGEPSTIAVKKLNFVNSIECLDSGKVVMLGNLADKYCKKSLQKEKIL